MEAQKQIHIEPIVAGHLTPFLLLADHFTLKEVEEERPVGASFMTAMVLTISKSPLHQTIVHPREEVSTQTFIPEQFIYGRSL